MKDDYRTLEAKVAYVLDRDELALTSDNHLVLQIWRTFYRHRMCTTSPAMETFAAVDILELPSKQQILAARRRARPKVKIPNGFQPWHQRCP